MDQWIGAQFEGDFASIAAKYVKQRSWQFPVSWARYDEYKDRYVKNAAGVSESLFGICVKNVPEEYRKWPEYTQSPPREDAWPEFADFILMAIDQLNPAWVEVCNEPNVGVKTASSIGEFFGGFIDDISESGDWSTKVLAAGREYGEMLAYISNRVWKHTGTVAVHGGALMENADTLKFAVGMGEPVCNMLTFHHYMHYPANFGTLETWCNNLRRLVKVQLGVSETGIRSQTPSAEHSTQKGEWMKYCIANRARLGLGMILGYTIWKNDWDYTDIAPGPAWDYFSRGAENG
jgi:hypothetical protein